MSDIKEGLWLNYIKRLHSLAESGLAFSPEEFDKERYEEISEICRTMMSELAVTPVQTINDLVTPFHQRYVTPQVEVRGAIFKENKILLVQEKSDSKWTMPGGYADVGLTAVQNIQKEISEEDCLNNVISKSKKGSIIVFHDSIKASKNMMYALPKVLEYFSEAGYKFKPLSF